MKLYALDFGWAGGMIVLANNREEAWKLMKEDGLPSEKPHINKMSLEEFELRAGLIVEFCGDR